MNVQRKLKFISIAKKVLVIFAFLLIWKILMQVTSSLALDIVAAILILLWIAVIFILYKKRMNVNKFAFSSFFLAIFFFSMFKIGWFSINELYIPLAIVSLDVAKIFAPEDKKDFFFKN